MHEIRKVAYAAAGPTITIVDMNRCILRACDVFLVGFSVIKEPQRGAYINGY